jgi:ketosteroid isomerase-like protein
MDPIEEILAIERAWTQAHLQDDPAVIEQIMAEDYVKILPNGSLSGKAETLAAYQPGVRYWDHAQGDEYNVRIYGDTAVVIGRWTARGMNNGQQFDYSARFLSIYVRRNGRWQMVADQSTEISR